MKKNVHDLRPTQFALGMYEVQQKIKKIQDMKESELENFLTAHPVPVVISQDGQMHIIDHHHLVRACWEHGVDKVWVEIKQDFSKMSSEKFWKEMERLAWMHPYDQFGKGPHAAGLLPIDVRGLADDVFRSLAWAVREEGGYEKSEEPFSEFLWADFFRKKIVIERSHEGFKAAIAEALKLCAHSECRHLPGSLIEKK